MTCHCILMIPNRYFCNYFLRVFPYNFFFACIDESLPETILDVRDVMSCEGRP